MPPPELELPHTLHDERHRLEEADVPIVTVSATFRGELAQTFGEQPAMAEEIVFSRAHYSMGVALLSQANELGLSSWLVDPANYVPAADWSRLAAIERFGQLAARIPLVKKIKDLLEFLVRGQVSLAATVKKPLVYVTERTTRPIISVHYETGNILARLGRRVVQVVTDPHVRQNYLAEAGRKNIVFAVFDKSTQDEFLKKARSQGRLISADRVVVTGPPVDPRIVAARKGKKSSSARKRGLRLVITTGGLGTNKAEITQLLEQLLPTLGHTELILYAGTHRDFRNMFYTLPAQFQVSVGDVDKNTQVRVIYDESIVRANQELIEHAFSWADGFITKPSGDMAYDALAAGCFILSLAPWGEWEEAVEAVVAGLGVCQRARPGEFAAQLAELKTSGWIQSAIKKALSADKLFLAGAQEVIKLQQKLAALDAKG